MFRLHCSPDLPDGLDQASLDGLEKAARRTLSRHAAGGLVDIILTGDDEVHRLNRTFRGRDQPTDVLSFSFVENGQQAITGDDVLIGEDVPAGEVYISLDRAWVQADELGTPRDRELARLLIHGLLHLAGFDHQTDVDLREMESLTDELLDTVAHEDPSWRTDSPKGV
jgi:probable rRNA maturation factor